MRKAAPFLAAIAAILFAATGAYAFRSGSHSHGFHHHRGYWWPYGYLATYQPPYYAEPQPVFAAPAQGIPTFHCTKSRETITVPAEAGGEKQVTVTRCN